MSAPTVAGRQPSVGPPGYAEHLSAYSSGRHIRVVNYHNTPRSARDPLRRELAGLQQRYQMLTIADLDRFYENGTWPDDRPGLFPVFYEGYRNNAEVAGEVCDELGIHALFFVCTGFLSCPPAEQEAYARSHCIELVGEDLEYGGRLAMSWDQVADLSTRHTVTPHTASHAGIAEVATAADLEREIYAPKRDLDAVTGQDSPAMAWLW